MKKNEKIEKMTEQEWADAAAWLSGEESADGEAARILLSEEGDIMKKWNDLRYTDTERSIDVDKAWNKLNQRIESEKPVIKLPQRSVMQSFLRIAAMVIIVAGLGWLAFEVAAPEKVIVASASDEKNIEVLLSDGSRVYLNRDSRLTYQGNFGRNSRRVTLEGEAYFDITPDPSRPFIIDAGNAKVRVLGTSFNVITDNGNNEVEVFVSTGRVMLSSNDGSQSMTLEPDFIGKLSADNSSQERNINTNYISWHTDMLAFEGERLSEVFADLKRTFNIDIVAADADINDFRLTSMFDNQPKDTIIQVICTTFNLRSVRDGETYSLLLR
ncbi:MAG: FecR domain-containing protein [Bacteroidales bacterium]|jgi:ferric-dicitrate binding protein FerR (iron transport regulator)|nr:FecR domain-containing protein [Bacteroidales bacterium]